MVEMVERVTKAILPAFDHIPDPEYRKTIAMSWARAAIEIMRKPTDEMIDAGLAVTASWHDLPGSALTVNKEKMRMRYEAMLKVANKPDKT